MAYDEDLAERIRGLLGDVEVIEKKMFGGLAFLVGGNMSVAASGQGGLLVKGWLRVDESVLGDDKTLGKWVKRGVTYASSLPPKK